MNLIMRLLAATPKTMTLPVVALLVGWYSGAKYGAPDWVMNSVDGMLARGGAAVGSLLNSGKEEPAPAEDNGETNGG